LESGAGLDAPCSLKAYGSHASLRGVQFAMIISNPAFLPTPDDSRHDVHSGKDALLGMDDLDTIVTAAPGGDPLPSAPPTPAEQPMSS